MKRSVCLLNEVTQRGVSVYELVFLHEKVWGGGGQRRKGYGTRVDTDIMPFYVLIGLECVSWYAFKVEPHQPLPWGAFLGHGQSACLSPIPPPHTPSPSAVSPVKTLSQPLAPGSKVNELCDKLNTESSTEKSN